MKKSKTERNNKQPLTVNSTLCISINHGNGGGKFHQWIFDGLETANEARFSSVCGRLVAQAIREHLANESPIFSVELKFGVTTDPGKKED